MRGYEDIWPKVLGKGRWGTKKIGEGRWLTKKMGVGQMGNLKNGGSVDG